MTLSPGYLERLRYTALHTAFDLLYGPLQFLHEPAGRILSGPAWPLRRSRLLELAEPRGVVLDLGCGSGLLLQEIESRPATHAIGIEVSPNSAYRARRNWQSVVLAHAQSLPFRAGSVDHVVCSYPGSWIFDSTTWDEVSRVVRSGGSITILLGGTVERGRWATIRSTLMSLVYGRSTGQTGARLADRLGNHTIPGTVRVVHDRWGTAYYWQGYRI